MDHRTQQYQGMTCVVLRYSIVVLVELNLVRHHSLFVSTLIKEFFFNISWKLVCGEADARCGTLLQPYGLINIDFPLGVMLE